MSQKSALHAGDLGFTGASCWVDAACPSSTDPLSLRVCENACCRLGPGTPEEGKDTQSLVFGWNHGHGWWDMHRLLL